MKKFKKGFLSIILVICFIFILLILYATFIYKEKVEVDDNFNKIIENINKSNFTKNYVNESDILLAKNENNNLVLTLASGNDKKDYIMEYKDFKIKLNINDDMTLDKTMSYTQIIVNAIGLVNNYNDGELTETVNKVFSGDKIEGITYENNTITIDTTANIKKEENIDKLEITNGKKVYYANLEPHALTEANYVIDFGNYLVSDVRIEHNTTYNIAKVVLQVNDFSVTKTDFKVTSKLYGSNKSDLINESTYEYKANTEENITIKINHLLSKNTNFENIKYIKIDIVKK